MRFDLKGPASTDRPSICASFNAPEQDRSYLARFYIHGIMSAIVEWLENDCSDSVDYLVSIIQQCTVAPHRP